MTSANQTAGGPLAVQIIRLGHRLAYLVERRLAPYGYNHTQAIVIMSLWRHPGITAQDLGSHVRVKPPNITRALQALEQRGLVCRQPHPTDGRASLLFLTDSGREAAGAIARLLREISAELEEVVLPGHRAALRESLGALLLRIEEMRGVEV